MNGHVTDVTVNENYNIIVVSNENTKGSFPETRRLCASLWEKMAGKANVNQWYPWPAELI